MERLPWSGSVARLKPTCERGAPSIKMRGWAIYDRASAKRFRPEKHASEMQTKRITIWHIFHSSILYFVRTPMSQSAQPHPFAYAHAYSWPILYSLPFCPSPSLEGLKPSPSFPPAARGDGGGFGLPPASSPCAHRPSGLSGVISRASPSPNSPRATSP